VKLCPHINVYGLIVVELERTHLSMPFGHSCEDPRFAMLFRDLCSSDEACAGRFCWLPISANDVLKSDALYCLAHSASRVLMMAPSSRTPRTRPIVSSGRWMQPQPRSLTGTSSPRSWSSVDRRSLDHSRFYVELNDEMRGFSHNVSKSYGSVCIYASLQLLIPYSPRSQDI
jgi:hypothetical protein